MCGEQRKSWVNKVLSECVPLAWTPPHGRLKHFRHTESTNLPWTRCAGKRQSLPCWPKCECARVYRKHPPPLSVLSTLSSHPHGLQPEDFSPPEWDCSDRVAKTASLVQLCARPRLFVQLFIINTLSFWILCQSESPVHPTPACLHMSPRVCLFIVPYHAS